MPVEYRNAAGLTSVTLNSLEATGNISAIGSIGQQGVGTYPSREGTNCVDYGCDVGTANGVRHNAAAFSINIEQDQFGLWCLPFEEFNGNTYLDLSGATPDAVRVRLYSGTNWAEWDLAVSGPFKLAPTWNPVQVSGDNHTRINGTWGATQRQNVDSWALVHNAVGDNNAGFFGDSTPDHAVDWATAGRDVWVTGTNGGQPWTLDAIYEALELAKPFHGLIERTGRNFILNCGLQIGDGSTPTDLVDSSAYIYVRQGAGVVRHDIRIEAAANVELGSKTSGGQGRQYATGGVRMVTDPFAGHVADFLVRDGATVKLYGCKLEGWNLVEFGDGTGADPDLDIIKLDVYNCADLVCRSGLLSIDDMRGHFSLGAEADLMRILETPTLMRGVQLFNVLKAIEMRADTTLRDLSIGDAVTHIEILEAVRAKLQSQDRIDFTRVERVAA